MSFRVIITVAVLVSSYVFVSFSVFCLTEKSAVFQEPQRGPFGRSPAAAEVSHQSGTQCPAPAGAFGLPGGDLDRGDPWWLLLVFGTYLLVFVEVNVLTYYNTNDFEVDMLLNYMLNSFCGRDLMGAAYVLIGDGEGLPKKRAQCSARAENQPHWFSSRIFSGLTCWTELIDLFAFLVVTARSGCQDITNIQDAHDLRKKPMREQRA